MAGTCTLVCSISPTSPPGCCVCRCGVATDPQRRAPNRTVSKNPKLQIATVAGGGPAHACWNCRPLWGVAFATGPQRAVMQECPRGPPFPPGRRLLRAIARDGVAVSCGCRIPAGPDVVVWSPIDAGLSFAAGNLLGSPYTVGPQVVAGSTFTAWPIVAEPLWLWARHPHGAAIYCGAATYGGTPDYYIHVHTHICVYTYVYASTYTYT